ncbi:MAG: mechanosensitive ion channel [Prevotellaceae bacterium]|nr:mechanosensitive ion channel [Prevotellaceae bacterium]
MDLKVTEYSDLVQNLIDNGTALGVALLKAVAIFLIGRLLIRLMNKLLRRVLKKRKVEASVASFACSLVNISLQILLIVSIIGVLGIQTASFAALLASVGVAIGMALSGNLSNFAGGLIILLFKPFRVGDFINAQGVSGTVQEIQIFHSIVVTTDNVKQYIPNGILSSGVVTNYNIETRRAEWIVGIDYGEDYERVKKVLEGLIAADSRILKDPAPFIALHKLDSSSVNVVVRAWTNAGDYWDVYFDMNKAIYATFNKEGIDFPFPQMTVHKAND